MAACTVDGCERLHRARGLCNAHWQRWSLGKDVNSPVVEKFRAPAKERFWRRVDRTASCWNWLGKLGLGGYGHFTIKFRTILAHRFAYETVVGPIPHGYHIDHLCHNPACVNPAHLEAVTPLENLQRSHQHRRLVKESVLWTG